MKKRILPALFCCALVFTGLCLGLLIRADLRAPSGRAPSVEPNLLHFPERNGIDPSVAADFWERWHFVTARYRPDVKQIRIVYANDLAWSAYQKRDSKFPEGAILAKAIFLTAQDPIFSAGTVPRMFSEVELMVKNSKRYPDSAGWGFALYDFLPEKKTAAGVLAENRLRDLPQTVQRRKFWNQSCFSCHQVAVNQDNVFSFPAFLNQDHLAWAQPSEFQGKFQSVSPADLSDFGRKVLKFYGKASYAQVKLFTVPHFLIGEAMALAPMAGFALAERKPFLMMGLKPPTFILTMPDEQRKDCAWFASSQIREPHQVRTGRFCGEAEVEKESKIFTR